MKAALPILGLCALVSGWVSAAMAAEAPPVTGAAVDESRVERTYYVDPAASETPGEGTQAAPFKSLGSAFEAAARDKDAGRGVKIVLADGVYRGAALFPTPANGKPDTDAPLVIEAANRQQAILEGAQTAGFEAAAWRREGAHWSHDWPWRPEPRTDRMWPEAVKPPNDITRRTELIFFNGAALRQVSTAQQLMPGSFCVLKPPAGTSARKAGKEADPTKPPPGQATAILQPPDGAEIEGALIEASATQFVGLFINQRRNVVARGLVIQHIAKSATDFPGALTFQDCSNVLVEDVLCQWNSGVGAFVIGRAEAPWNGSITLRRVQAINNGGAGLFAARLKNLLVEDCETSFNNFRGDWSGWIDPAGPAGCKVSLIHGGAWRRHHAVGNWCRGLSWAGDCADITLEDSTVRNNLVSGLLIENNPGPVSVRRCVINGTRSHPSVRAETAYPAAVSICATPDVTLENCIAAANTMPQLGLWDTLQNADHTDFETGKKQTLRAERHVYRHNVFAGLDAEQPLFNLPTTDRAGKGAFDFYYATLTSDSNCFWNPARADVFCNYDRSAYDKPGMDFDRWRAFLAQRVGAGKPAPEAASIWRDPLFIDPMEGDFRLKAASPVLDWGLTSDERAPE